MAEGSPEHPARTESGEIATSTLAEIYAQQGLLGRALSIYRRMLARAPDDLEIAQRIERLERRIAEAGATGTSEEGTREGAPEPEVVRERLPWDPPEEQGEPSRRPMGPIDPSIFEAWLGKK